MLAAGTPFDMAGRNYTAITLNQALSVNTFTQENVFNVNAGLLEALAS